MKNNLFKFSIIGFIFVSITGSLSHFVFEWSGYNLAVAAVFPVNESIWEHLKLLFFPYLIWTVIEYCLLKKEKGLLMSKFIASIIGMASIVIFYYTYTGVSGKSIEILNILSFFIGVSIAFAADNYLIKSKNFQIQNMIHWQLHCLSAQVHCFSSTPSFRRLFRCSRTLFILRTEYKTIDLFYMSAYILYSMGI